MQTRLADFLNDTKTGREIENLLRSCVHCGFCNATCPTYQLLGDELDGPRGRIYLIKQLAEGDTVSQQTLNHLDRCLSCGSCETTCPSSMQYRRLLDIGRELAERGLTRPWWQRLQRKLLLLSLPYPSRIAAIIGLGRLLRPLLPATLQAKLPARSTAGQWPVRQHSRRMLIMQGCVQPALAPRINLASAQVLDRLGISLLPVANCCGALPYHLNDSTGGLTMMRQMIDACWPQIEAGAEAIVSTASGCGVTLKDYGRLLQDDGEYAAKAARFSALCRDLSEIIATEQLSVLQPLKRKIAFHAPCTLQHGQQLPGQVENLLTNLGFELTAVADSHLCCGSAGSYSLLQPELSGRLQKARISALQAQQPELIATANIGCWLQLQEKASVPVVHWIELLV